MSTSRTPHPNRRETPTTTFLSRESRESRESRKTTFTDRGWLREASRLGPPQFRALRDDGEVPRRNAMRRCIFFPVPDGFQYVPPTRVGASFDVAVPSPRPLHQVAGQTSPRYRQDPRKFARELPAFQPGFARRELEAAAPIANGRTARVAPLEQALVVGALVLFVPPMGLAVVWQSLRYSREARIALSAMAMLTMGLWFLIALRLL